MGLCEVHSSFKGHFPVLDEVALVTYQVNSNIFTSMSFDFPQPFDQVDEGLITSNIIGEEDTVSSPIENSCHRPE